MPEPDKQPVKQPEVKPAPKAVETEQYKEFVTLNGAVRRDLK